MFRRFTRWHSEAVFEKVFQGLAVGADFEYVLVDGIIVRLHHNEAGEKWDCQPRSDWSLASGSITKVIVMVDALDYLVSFALLPGRRHGVIGASSLLLGIYFGALIADRAYDNDKLRAELRGRDGGDSSKVESSGADRLRDRDV